MHKHRESSHLTSKTDKDSPRELITNFPTTIKQHYDYEVTDF